MKRAVAAGVALIALSAVVWMAINRSKPRTVPFARVVRETLVSTLTTNGKIEPVEYAAVRSDVDAMVLRVLVERGQKVAAGTAVATLDVSGAQGELAEAQTAIAQAEADLGRFARGGDAAALAEIDSAIDKARLELGVAEREAASIQRLVDKNAATRQELEAARDRIRQLRSVIEGLERKRGALLPEGERAAVEARLRQAQTSAALARQRLERGTIRAPIAGEVYHVAVRPGVFLHPGDLVAELGRLDRVRVVMYVDEPELSRVAKEMPVTITWDGAPGMKWTGQVEQLPAQITTMGTRQVGEVICIVENKGGTLEPGANVNAEVRSAVAENALTIPKEAVRRNGPRTGVLVLAGDRVQWREVRLGVSSVTRVQVLDGVREAEAVALPVEFPLADGDQVSSIFPR